MHDRACRAHGSRGGLPNPEGAWRVLWPCDPIIGQRMLALHWRPLHGAGSTPDWLSWILPPRQESCRVQGSRRGLLNREGALKVLWPCDPMIGHRRMMALHWRPLRGAGSTPDWLSLDTSTETTVMQGMRPWIDPADSMRYFFPA
jgi:hypothetical protein